MKQPSRQFNQNSALNVVYLEMENNFLPVFWSKWTNLVFETAHHVWSFYVYFDIYNELLTALW